jgi:uncharacterized delta-60 repeat protein
MAANTAPKFLLTGSVSTDFGIDGGARAQSMLVQPDGKIIIGGASSQGEVLARFLPNGNLDASFGDSGKIIVKPDTFFAPLCIALQNDGKILTSGFSPSGNGIAVRRHNSDGSLDNTFGKKGEITILDFR